MKVRSDFVTNSSSSSFIIGKKGDTTNLDTVFILVRDLYKKYLANLENLKKNAKQEGLVFDEKEQQFTLANLEDVFGDMGTWEKTQELSKKYDVFLWDSYNFEKGWLTCNSYAEYEQFWVDKIQNDKSLILHAPFSIVDFSNSTQTIPVERGDFSLIVGETLQNNVLYNVAEWYYPCMENYNDGKSVTEYICKYCDNKSKEHCDAIKKAYTGDEKPSIPTILKLLGKVCICSECGYILSKVVDELNSLSEYSCNHMG